MTELITGIQNYVATDVYGSRIFEKFLRSEKNYEKGLFVFCTLFLVLTFIHTKKKTRILKTAGTINFCLITSIIFDKVLICFKFLNSVSSNILSCNSYNFDSSNLVTSKVLLRKTIILTFSRLQTVLYFSNFVLFFTVVVVFYFYYCKSMSQRFSENRLVYFCLMFNFFAGYSVFFFTEFIAASLLNHLIHLRIIQAILLTVLGIIPMVYFYVLITFLKLKKKVQTKFFNK